MEIHWNAECAFFFWLRKRIPTFKIIKLKKVCQKKEKTKDRSF